MALVRPELSRVQASLWDYRFLEKAMTPKESSPQPSQFGAIPLGLSISRENDDPKRIVPPAPLNLERFLRGHRWFEKPMTPKGSSPQPLPIWSDSFGVIDGSRNRKPRSESPIPDVEIVCVLIPKLLVWAWHGRGHAHRLGHRHGHGHGHGVGMAIEMGMGMCMGMGVGMCM